MKEVGLPFPCRRVILRLVLSLSFVIVVLAITLQIKERKRVVCVGLVCLDLVTVVDHFPKEDTDMRSSAQYKVSPILKMAQKTMATKKPSKAVNVKVDSFWYFLAGTWREREQQLQGAR